MATILIKPYCQLLSISVMNNKEQVDQEMNLKDENLNEETAENTSAGVEFEGGIRSSRSER